MSDLSGTPRAGRPARVAVFRALALGDMLCAVPALRALRRGYPDAEIELIGLPWSRELVRRFPAYIDGFVEFPGWPGIPEVPFEPARLPGFLAKMQARRYDLAIQLHGSGLASNGFVEALGAARSAGAYLPGEWRGADQPAFIPYPAELHEIHRLLAVVEAAGCGADGDRLEFPVGREDELALRQLPSVRDLARGSFVVLHPGAGATARRWGVERFAAAGDALAARGLTVVLTGVKAEASVTAEVAAGMRARAIDLAGRTSLGTLAALLDRAALLVSNDTGVAHLAAARDIPSVVVFLAADLRRWAPLDRELHRTVGPGRPSPCARPDGVATCLMDGCTRPERLDGSPEVPDVPVEAVLTAVDDLLAGVAAGRLERPNADSPSSLLPDPASPATSGRPAGRSRPRRRPG